MVNRVIRDITDFIFMKDLPGSCDVILIPGTSQSVITEKAAELYREGWAPYVLPSGGCSSSIGHYVFGCCVEICRYFCKAGYYLLSGISCKTSIFFIYLLLSRNRAIGCTCKHAGNFRRELVFER